jgi:hypothetical protein
MNLIILLLNYGPMYVHVDICVYNCGSFYFTYKFYHCCIIISCVVVVIHWSLYFVSELPIKFFIIVV